MNIGVVIYTYNRVDDAKINQEIIRHVWGNSGLFDNIRIIHSFNGQKSWYPEKYLEDELVTIDNPGHLIGAANLIDAGFQKLQESYPDTDYLIVLAADTWLIKPEFVLNYCQKLKTENKLLAGSSWSELPAGTTGSILKGVSTDFFILNFAWTQEHQVLPMGYEKFWSKYFDFFYYQQSMPSVEKLFLSRFLAGIHQQYHRDIEIKQNALEKIISISEREPVHVSETENSFYVRQMYWPEIGLFTHHDPHEKQIAMQSTSIEIGPNWQKLKEATDTAYFNQGFISYQKVN